MAEIFGVIAGAASCAELVAQILSNCTGIYNSAKEAPDTIQRLRKEIASFERVLSAMRREISYSNSDIHGNSGSTAIDTPPQRFDCLIEPLQETQKMLTEMNQHLDMIKKNQRKGKLKWALGGEKRVEGKLAVLARFRALFLATMELDDRDLARKARETMNEIQSELRIHTTLLQDIKTCITTQITSEKRNTILDWLNGPHPANRHQQICKERHSQTGVWIWEDDNFDKWVYGIGSRILWGHGVSGAGKTFLSSVIIDHLKKGLSGGFIAYYYFDYAEQENCTLLTLLFSIIKQILLEVEPRVLQEVGIEKLFDHCQQNGQLPTVEQLTPILYELMRCFSQVYLILDGLDECEEESRADLLPFIIEVGKSGRVSVFITSQQYPEDIREAFNQGVAKLHIRAQDQDLELFLRSRIKSSTRMTRWIRSDSGLEERIVRCIIKCSSKIFLLAQFHLQQLCQATTLREVKEELQNIQQGSVRGIHSHYDRAMKRMVSSKSDSENKQIRQIFSWVAKSRRPLTANELREAIAHVCEFKDSPWYHVDHDDMLTDDLILGICDGLVIIDEDTSIVRFIHFSFKDYLYNKALLDKDHSDMTIACVQHLLYALKRLVNSLDGALGIESVSLENSTNLEKKPEFEIPQMHNPPPFEDTPNEWVAEGYKYSSFVSYASENLRYHSAHSREEGTEKWILELANAPFQLLQDHHYDFIFTVLKPIRNLSNTNRKGTRFPGSGGSGGIRKRTSRAIKFRHRTNSNIGLLVNIVHAIGLINLKAPPVPWIQKYAMEPSSRHGSPLHISAALGHLTATSKILEQDYQSIYQRNATDWQPIQLAVEYGHFPVAIFLLRNGALIPQTLKQPEVAFKKLKKAVGDIQKNTQCTCSLQMPGLPITKSGDKNLPTINETTTLATHGNIHSGTAPRYSRLEYPLGNSGRRSSSSSPSSQADTVASAPAFSLGSGASSSSPSAASSYSVDSQYHSESYFREERFPLSVSLMSRTAKFNAKQLQIRNRVAIPESME